MDKLTRDPQWSEDYDLFAAMPEPQPARQPDDMPPPSPPSQSGEG